MKYTKNHLFSFFSFFLVVLAVLTVLFLTASPASAASVEIAYITDIDSPFPLGDASQSLSGVNLNLYALPGDSDRLSTGVSEDLVFIDVRSEANLEMIDSLKAGGKFSGTVLLLTKDADNLFSAEITSSESFTDTDELTAAQYWTRHPENLKNLLIWSADKFAGQTLGPAADPIDMTDPDNRTSVLLVVTPNAVAISSVTDELSEYGIDLKFANLTALQSASSDSSVIPSVLEEIDQFDGDIILEIAAPGLNPTYEANISAAVERSGAVAVLGKGLSLNASNLTVSVPTNSGLDAEDIAKIKLTGNYWATVLPENLVRMFVYMSVHADGRADLDSLIKPTMNIPTIGIYHPDAPTLTYGANNDELPHLFDDRSAYNNWYADYKSENGLEDNGQWIAVSSYYRDYQEGKMHTEEMMIRKLEAEGYNVLAFFHPASASADVSAYFSENPADGKPVDVFIHFQTFGANAPLNKYGAPVLEAVLLSSYTSLEEWQGDPNGLKKSTFYYKIDQSESAGSVFPVGVEIQMTVDDPIPYPIEDRVDRLLGQVKGYSNLRHTPNEEKNIALIYFNHPPGKQNIGASYFDLFGSLEMILSAMKDDEYDAEVWTEEEIYDKIMTGGRNVGGWAPGELEKLVNEGLADDSVVLLPVSTYEKWVDELSDGQKKIIDEMTAEWGAPGKSDFMTVTRNGERFFVLPIIRNGNIILAPEPARGWEEDLEKLYHDMNIPVPHQYAAFYLWLQKPAEDGGFGADAMVHLGRHGTQEFLPGKMICMDESSAADLMVGDVPNIYPYIVDGSGEALQAKRRGYATVITHLTPPIAQSGLSVELSGLNEKIIEYERAKSGGGDSSGYKNSIIEILGSSTVANDLGIDVSGFDDDAYFEESLEEITEYLEIITQQSIPYGTHVFGSRLSDEKMSMFVETIYADRLFSISCSLLGFGENPDYGERDEARLFASSMALMIVESTSKESFISAAAGALEVEETALAAQKTDLENLYTTALGTINKLDGIWETEGLLSALNGRYIETSPLGDPVRNEDVLSTGRNPVGFVSNRVPTAEAEAIGIKMADEMISAYYNETGSFPEKIGVVLWSVETFRHDGVMEAMAIHLMGGEIIRAASGSVTNTKITVLSEDNLKVMTKDGALQRPRVDVVFTISGLYRDTLPYQIRLLNSVVSMISAYDSDNTIENHVRSNTLGMEAQLNGLSNADKEEIIRSYKEADPSYEGGLDDFDALAAQLSKIRIFGPPPESYGTGIEKEIEAGQGWDSDSAIDKIAELYIFRMANMYTVNSAGDIIFLGNFGIVFEMNLKGVEIVTNSRSSNLYGILDNDDFFQYVGGMSAAVQSLDENKQPPQVQVVNLRIGGKESVQSLSEFLTLEIRSRALNEKYLQGMMESGYSGMKEISEIVDNLWGWQVTTPHAVSEYMWNDVYTALVTNQDVSDAFRNSNPYAYESMLTRMIDANAKGYWNPSETTIQNLAKELAETVVASGVACCHHTCGNPTLNNHIAGILSIPGVVEKDVAKQWQQLTEEATNVKIKPTNTKPPGKSSSGTGAANIVESGTDGTEQVQADPVGQSQEETKNPGQGAGTDMTSTPGQSVSGFEMTVQSISDAANSVRDFIENPTFSATSLVAILFVVGTVGALFYGFRRKNI
ncbi:hypothetical protein MmiAt1_05270 [Methanimicrococcus sp. At1]|uniref:CobN/magnesium chelatase domain-containing protein n=1 Tax=Methanimicrococcus hacksteinii TaxID=3028293 RepID=A0ABU3VNJ8_9EURY|nr:cobaltochelatase subunit CobN [Methanimicrococcus sp. At1]MDV0444975.1 hypothetical protein [Methanimicrococcus sp. At1]